MSASVSEVCYTDWRAILATALTRGTAQLAGEEDIMGTELQRIFYAETRPTIVCLCGSSRFYDEFQQANYDLTMAGEIVLSIGFYPHAKAQHGHGEGVGHGPVEKIALDELHKRKIDLADYVYVLDVDGYVGESTKSEIVYASQHSIPVRYLSQERPSTGIDRCGERPIDPR